MGRVTCYRLRTSGNLIKIVKIIRIIKFIKIVEITVGSRGNLNLRWTPGWTLRFGGKPRRVLAETQTDGREGRQERDENGSLKNSYLAFLCNLEASWEFVRLSTTAQIYRKAAKKSETEPGQGELFTLTYPLKKLVETDRLPGAVASPQTGFLRSHPLLLRSCRHVR